jgi:hypothetical protein
LNDTVLEVKYVAERTIEAIAPDMTAVSHVEQPKCRPDALATPRQTPLQAIRWLAAI